MMMGKNQLKRERLKTGTVFPGGPVVKNLPSNAGDVGSIPGGRTKNLTCQGANKPAHISTMEPHTSGESVHCN